VIRKIKKTFLHLFRSLLNTLHLNRHYECQQKRVAWTHRFFIICVVATDVLWSRDAVFKHGLRFHHDKGKLQCALLLGDNHYRPSLSISRELEIGLVSKITINASLSLSRQTQIRLVLKITIHRFNVQYVITRTCNTLETHKVVKKRQALFLKTLCWYVAKTLPKVTNWENLVSITYSVSKKPTVFSYHVYAAVRA